MRQRKRPRSDGIEWVYCRICGDHRRAISGRHLFSKHDTDAPTSIRTLEQGAPRCCRNQKTSPRKGYRSRISILRALCDAVEHYFRSLRNAFVALKKDQRLFRAWSKQKVIPALSRMHRSKVSLAYASARRDVPALASAAEAHFGSWGKALYAAGIDPSLYFVHHKWRD